MFGRVCGADSLERAWSCCWLHGVWLWRGKNSWVAVGVWFGGAAHLCGDAWFSKRERWWLFGRCCSVGIVVGCGVLGGVRIVLGAFESSRDGVAEVGFPSAYTLGCCIRPWFPVCSFAWHGIRQGNSLSMTTECALATAGRGKDRDGSRVGGDVIPSVRERSSIG